MSIWGNGLLFCSLATSRRNYRNKQGERHHSGCCTVPLVAVDLTLRSPRETPLQAVRPPWSVLLYHCLKSCDVQHSSEHLEEHHGCILRCPVSSRVTPPSRTMGKFHELDDYTRLCFLDAHSTKKLLHLFGGTGDLVPCLLGINLQVSLVAAIDGSIGRSYYTIYIGQDIK